MYHCNTPKPHQNNNKLESTAIFLICVIRLAKYGKSNTTLDNTTSKAVKSVTPF